MQVLIGLQLHGAGPGLVDCAHHLERMDAGGQVFNAPAAVGSGGGERLSIDDDVGLVDRLFGGRAAPLVAHLAEAEALTDDDIAEIEKLLKEMKA